MKTLNENPFNKLLNFIRFVLREQENMCKQDRENSQVMMSIEVYGLKFVVGKGGFVTAFYYEGDNVRKICHIKDIEEVVEKWKKKKYIAYFGCDGNDKVIAGPMSKLKYALAISSKKGYTIVAYGNSKKRTVLYRHQRNLNGESTWLQIEKTTH